MPESSTRTLLDIDLAVSDWDARRRREQEFIESDPLSEEIVYASPAALWNGIEVMRSRHYLKRLRVDLKKHTIISHVTDASFWQTRRGKDISKGSIAAGSVEILSAGNEYDFLFSGGEHEDIYLMFTPDFLRRLAEENEADAGEIELRWQENLHDPFIHHVLQAFDTELRAGCPGGRLLGDSLGIALGVHLLNRYATISPRLIENTAGLSKTDLGRIRDFVRGNLHLDLTVPEIAQVVNMSPFHFSRLFRAATHLSPYQYVLQERAEKAKQLLLTRSIPLAQIAVDSGFASQSNLNRHFKRIYGVPPGVLLRSELQSTNGQKERRNGEESTSSVRDNDTAGHF